MKRTEGDGGIEFATTLSRLTAFKLLLEQLATLQFDNLFRSVDSSRSVCPVLSVRPKVAELSLQLYGRSLHPELFEIHCSRTVERNGFSVKVDIATSGHVITWRYQGQTLTEVAASRQHPLPQKRRLMQHPLKGSQSDKVKCRCGVSYEVNFALETVKPELFWAFQQQLSGTNEHQGLVHTFDSSGRMALGALSYINIETRTRKVRIQAFHTFPDDYALVKTESVFELPRTS
ncbi:MAG: DUF2617 family protein [Planctomycetales bacterium]|nr:DUF2617 family protein [Planctomycetales bacterium]